MKLMELANDIKAHIESGSAWLTKAAEEVLPGFLAEAEKFQANPIVAALEGLVLPPDAEQAVVNLIKAFASVLEHQPEAPAAPAEPAPAPPAEPSAPEVPADPAAG